MTDETFYTDQSTLLTAVFLAVGEQVGELVDEQLGVLRSLPQMREAVLHHCSKIREVLPDAEFRFFRPKGKFTLEVHTSEEHIMNIEACEIARNELKEQYSIQVQKGYTQEELDELLTGPTNR